MDKSNRESKFEVKFKGQGHSERKCKRHFSHKSSSKSGSIYVQPRPNDHRAILHISIDIFHERIERKCLVFVIFICPSVSRIPHIIFVDSDSLSTRKPKKVHILWGFYCLHVNLHINVELRECVIIISRELGPHVATAILVC